MASRPWVLAIDFGTSFTVAAALAEGRSPEVIEIDGDRRVPSVVLVERDDSIVVGRIADELSAANPESTLRAPKSRLGDQVPVVLNGRPHQVVNLVAALLRHVYAKAVAQMDGPPSEVRLTHPATWNRLRVNRLVEAAAKAGLPAPSLVSEPVAAAFTYASDADIAPGAHVAVYDLGGGTFDTAVVAATANGFAVVGRPGGDVSIGGELFDEMLMNHIGERLDPAAWEQIQVAGDWGWQRVAATLRSEARRAKETLSSHPYADVVLPLPTGLVQIRIEQSEYEALIGAHIDETVSLLGRTITNAGLTPNQLAAIYLVGGASRAPIVERLTVAAFPGVAVSQRGEPKTAVALGAARATGTSPEAVITGAEGSTEDSAPRTADVPVVLAAPMSVPPAAATMMPPPPPSVRPGVPTPPPTIGPATYYEDRGQTSTSAVVAAAAAAGVAGAGVAGAAGTRPAAAATHPVAAAQVPPAGASPVGPPMGPAAAAPPPAGPAAGGAPPSARPPIVPSGPTGTPPGGGSGAGGPKKKKVGLAVGLAAIVLAAAVAGIAIMSTGGKSDAPDAGEIFLEPANAVGTNPFTQNLTTAGLQLPDLTKVSFPSIPGLPDISIPNITLPDVTLPDVTLPDVTLPEVTLPVVTVPEGSVAVPTASGGQPGLYGGTRDRTLCDVKQLVDFLAQNIDKATAWAGVQGIAVEDIADYVASLTGVILGRDTRVTNYGFKDGKAPAKHTILQAGTAVLVDIFGVPRVRCFCGNPLSPPKPVKKPKYSGDPWPGFSTTTVIVIAASPTPIQTITIIDVFTNDPFEVAVGSPVDEPLPPTLPPTSVEETTTVAETTTSSSTTVAETTTTVAETTTTVGEPVDITAQGVVAASSEYPDGNFPASNALDGDPTSSWFSAGPPADDYIVPGIFEQGFAGQTSFVWTAPAGPPPLITSITVVGNALHPDFPTGFGFAQVEIEVTDADGFTLFTQILNLDGTPDPDVTVATNVRGSFVVLTFYGSEAPDCGGFAELYVMASA